MGKLAHEHGRIEFIGLLWGVLAMTAWWCTAKGHMTWESKVTKVTSCSL